jgi:outer membrane protein
MKTRFQVLTPALAALLVSVGAAAQDNVVKFGVSEYTTHSRTNGISGVGVPAGADAETGNSTTVILVYERMFTPNIGGEFVIGLPPKIKAKATGTVAFLGDDVLSARNVSPTLFLNFHFGTPGDVWRPYLGAGINYTRFVRVESKLAPDVKMSDSTGWAAQAGVDYTLNREWSLFASVAALKVKSKVVASGSTVLQTTIDFRPIVYTVGLGYRF